MRKLNRVQLSNLLEVVKRGAIPASEWTTGSGRHITKRTIPIFCDEINVRDIPKLKGFAKKHCQKLLKDRPKLQKIIVCTEIRKANKALKNWELIK